MAPSYLRGLRPSRDRRTIPVANGTTHPAPEADAWRRLSGSPEACRRDGARSPVGLRDSLAPPPALPAHLRHARRDDRGHTGRNVDGAAATRSVDAAEDRASRTDRG